MQISKIRSKDRGFTIIEVVLVLAIAGLIFILVFIAMPFLQKSRRDHQRKVAAQNVLASLNQLYTYPTNPTKHDEFVATLTGELFVDPTTGSAYDIPYRDYRTASHADMPAVGQIFYQVAHFCGDGSGDPISSAPSGHITSDVVVWVGLELNRYACYDNG